MSLLMVLGSCSSSGVPSGLNSCSPVSTEAWSASSSMTSSGRLVTMRRPGVGVGRVGDVSADPPEQLRQDRLVLLHDEEPGPLLWRDREVLRHVRVEVAVVGARGGAMRSDLHVAVELADADGLSGIAVRGGLVAEEALFESDLGLRAQVVVHARQHDDDLVAGVGGFADEPGVVAGLARLDMPHDEPAAVPRSLAIGVFQQPEDVVGGLVQRVDHIDRKLALQVVADSDASSAS